MIPRRIIPKGYKYAVSRVFVVGLLNTIDKLSLQFYGMFLFTFLKTALQLPYLIITAQSNIVKDVKGVITNKKLKLFIFVVFSNILGMYFYYKAMVYLPVHYLT